MEQEYTEPMAAKQFKLVRTYHDLPLKRRRRVLRRNLTREQAIELTTGTEARSETATSETARARTKSIGRWEDTYEPHLTDINKAREILREKGMIP